MFDIGVAARSTEDDTGKYYVKKQTNKHNTKYNKYFSGSIMSNKKIV